MDGCSLYYTLLFVYLISFIILIDFQVRSCGVLQLGLCECDWVRHGWNISKAFITWWRGRPSSESQAGCALQNPRDALLADYPKTCVPWCVLFISLWMRERGSQITNVALRNWSELTRKDWFHECGEFWAQSRKMSRIWVGGGLQQGDMPFQAEELVKVKS